MQRHTEILGGLALAVVLTVGCKRHDDADSAGDAAPLASAPDLPHTRPPPTAEASSEPIAYARSGPAPGEAELRIVPAARREDDPVLRPYGARIRNHFKDAKAPLTVQRATLFGGGMAVLVRQQTEPFPLLLVEDRERKLLWERDKPTAAMLPPVRDPVIVGRPRGGVALFAYDVPAKVLAGRLTDPDGTPFADLNVIHAEDCQSVSAAYWPRHGMVATCARIGSARMQLVRSDNTLAFPPEGVPVGAPFRAPAPLAIAFDTDDTMLLAQHATKDGKDHVFVLRYGADGVAKWPAPHDVGEVPHLDAPDERIVMTSTPGGAQITLAHGLVDRPSVRTIEIDSNGVTRTP